MAVLLALILAGCSGAPTGTPAVGASADATHVAAASDEPAPTPLPTEGPTPGPAITSEPTPIGTPQPTFWPCPETIVISVIEFVRADPACHGDDAVRIRAWLDAPPPMGWLPPLREPGWLNYPAESSFNTLWSSPPETDPHLCPDTEDCAGILVHLPPDSEVELDGPARWVIAIGHRNDPAAETCHYVESDVAPGPFDDEALRDVCRDSFVLEAIESVDTAHEPTLRPQFVVSSFRAP